MHAQGRRIRAVVPRRRRGEARWVLRRLGRRDGRQPRRRHRDAGRGHPRPAQLRGVGRSIWPGSDIEPFATFINGVAKYVATSTPLDREWANTTVVDGDLVDFVRDLRNQPGARHRRPRKHLGRPGTACRGRRRRAQAGDRTDDRGQRAEAPRRLAGDSARVDPKHDLTELAICSSTTASSGSGAVDPRVTYRSRGVACVSRS